MKEELLLVHAGQAVDILFVFAGAERRNHDRLGLAAGEQRRTMGARQDADFGDDRADRREVTAVDAALGVEDVPANDLGLHFLEGRHDLVGRPFRLAAFRQEGRLDLGLGCVDGDVALLLVDILVGGAQIVLDQAEHGGFEFRQVGRREVARLLGGDFGELDDRVDHRLERLVAEHDRAEHGLLVEFLGFRLDHQHGVGGAGDDEVKLRLGHFVDMRVENVLAVDEADAGAADRAHEGHAGDRQRGRRSDQRQDVRIVLQIMLHDGDDDLGVVLVTGREERADRAVDQAGNQRFLLARTAFALEVAARDLAGGIGLFLVVDGEREEIEAGLRLLHGNDGRENDGFAVGREHRAISLARDLAGFQDERTTAPLDFHLVVIEHVLSLICGTGRTGLSGARQGSWLRSWTSHGQDNGRLERETRFPREHPAILPHDLSMGGSGIVHVRFGFRNRPDPLNAGPG